MTKPSFAMRKLMVVLQLSRISGWISGLCGDEPCSVASALLAAERISIPEHLQQGQLVVGHASVGARSNSADASCMSVRRAFVFGPIVMSPSATLEVRYADGRRQRASRSQKESTTSSVEGLPRRP
jgi:hypothetical protein